VKVRDAIRLIEEVGRFLAVFIAALLFLAMPIVLLFVVRDWRALGPLVVGAGLVWPIWKITQNNRPRSYDPLDPPGELME